MTSSRGIIFLKKISKKKWKCGQKREREREKGNKEREREGRNNEREREENKERKKERKKKERKKARKRERERESGRMIFKLNEVEKENSKQDTDFEIRKMMKIRSAIIIIRNKME